MDPWKDSPKKGRDATQQKQVQHQHPPQSGPLFCSCKEYPSCPKEERKFLQEIRSVGKDIPKTYVLSNGMKATDFSLLYIVKNHFQKKK